MPYNWNNYNRQKRKDYRNERPDHQPGQRMAYEQNRKKILASQDICAICGRPVDKSLKYPDPNCATVDHIIPVSRGGHPSDISNLQLAHLKCNLLKSNNAPGDSISRDEQMQTIPVTIGLPWAVDWTAYKETGEGSNAEALWEQAEKIRAAGKIITARGII